MIHADGRYYANGRKKKYNAWSTKKTKVDIPFREMKPSDTYRRETQQYNSIDNGVGICAKPEKKEYTGTLVKGISTMHKSNAVPIINNEEAKEHASMRR
jgi:hypothetical protein